jgi:hypothetical protein
MTENGSSLPIGITPEVFAHWRSPRCGNANPEQMNNPLWQWLIETRLDAYQANKALKGPSSFEAGPMWCFDRFGQSVTRLPDDSTVLIGGEHEDYYDPDFFIYNDLVVTTQDGRIEIYGYPRTIFPPTDFHTASLKDECIILLGNLGYPGDRRIGQTQVLVVERPDWRVSRIDSLGSSPGWIHSHHAELQADGASILVKRGKLFRGAELSLVENIDEWKLHLNGWRWERMTERRWVRFELYRKDRTRNHLFELRQALWEREMKWDGRDSFQVQLQTELGGPPRLDLIPSLYRPSIPHDLLPAIEDEYRVHRIRVDGVVVRYVEDSSTVQVTVEGELPAEVVEQIRQELTGALETLEQSPIVHKEIPS